MISVEDLRAAVQGGVVSEAQAARLISLAQARGLAKSGLSPSEEPFVLFKGFNEIFIIVGLSILFGGWTAMIWLWVGGPYEDSPLASAVMSVVTLAGLASLQGYFTSKRRMVGPSMLLALMTGCAITWLGIILAEALHLGAGRDWALTSGLVALGMVLHYRAFRVPFDAAIIAVSGFAALWSLISGEGVIPLEAWALLSIFGSGSAGIVSILFGLVCFGVAMWFDMRDPHRVSTRAATGFWLHVLAAPAILNPLAVTLMDQGQVGQFGLIALLNLLALVALIIDRRSFLVSGALYAVWLVFALLDGSVFTIFALGLGLVVLGAQWERLRAALLRALPDFAGKTRLPPYGMSQ